MGFWGGWNESVRVKHAVPGTVKTLDKLLLREKSVGRKRITYKRVWVEWIPALGMILEAIPAVQSSNVMAEASEAGLF